MSEPEVLPAGAFRPTLRWMLGHPARWIALGFGAGLSRLAPGTVGTAWAWASWLIVAPHLSPGQQGLLIAAAMGVGWWACTEAARHMAVLDPGAIVWDEVVAFWIVLWLVMPAGFGAQVAAFALFRFFDAVKPGPVRWADERFHGFGAAGGFGILFDDLVAAFCTLLVIAGWRAWL